MNDLNPIDLKGYSCGNCKREFFGRLDTGWPSKCPYCESLLFYYVKSLRAYSGGVKPPRVSSQTINDPLRSSGTTVQCYKWVANKDITKKGKLEYVETAKFLFWGMEIDENAMQNHSVCVVEREDGFIQTYLPYNVRFIEKILLSKDTSLKSKKIVEAYGCTDCGRFTYFGEDVEVCPNIVCEHCESVDSMTYRGERVLMDKFDFETSFFHGSDDPKDVSTDKPECKEIIL